MLALTTPYQTIFHRWPASLKVVMLLTFTTGLMLIQTQMLLLCAVGLPFYLIASQGKRYLWFSPTKYNPVFMGPRIGDFGKVKPEDVGIIASKIDMSQVTEYLVGEEEFRVPVSAILSAKRVLY